MTSGCLPKVMTQFNGFFPSCIIYSKDFVNLAEFDCALAYKCLLGCVHETFWIFFWTCARKKINKHKTLLYKKIKFVMTFVFECFETTDVSSSAHRGIHVTPQRDAIMLQLSLLCVYVINFN